LLTHRDFVYAGENATFQMPFSNLGLDPEVSTCSVPALVGHIRAAELILLGRAFDGTRAAELGLVTRVIPDEPLLTTATETAQNLAQKPSTALQACKRLMKWSIRVQVEDAMRAENDDFASRLHATEAKEAMRALRGLSQTL
jgi:enoyl-CoA hydratase/carnithine racemase